jgi:nucleotide-binding universal stress UspA family protein
MGIGLETEHATPLGPEASEGHAVGPTDSSALRELLVFVDARAGTPAVLEFAASLAREHGARLTGVFIQPEARFSAPEMFVRGPGIHATIEKAHERLRRAESDRRALFELVVRREAIPWEWRSVGNLLASDLAVHAQYADLAVVAREDPSEERVIPPGLVESLVSTSGRPIMVFPPRCPVSRVRRILVGWNAGREATRAVAGAMPLLTRAEAVEVVVVDGNRAAGHGEEPGADIARHLVRHGVRVDVCALPSGSENVGHVLLSRAARSGADLIVMGAYGHSRLSEWVFGGVTRTALLEATVPLLMSA